MSRSHRLPYSTLVCCGSAKWDKQHAHRGERSAHKQHLRNTLKDENYWDDVPFPIREECSWNNVWNWGRDGHQHLVQMCHNDYNPYYYRRWRYFTLTTEEEFFADHEDDVARQLKRIEELKRK